MKLTKLTRLSAAPEHGRLAWLSLRRRRMPARANGMGAGTASQPIPGVLRTWRMAARLPRRGGEGRKMTTEREAVITYLSSGQAQDPDAVALARTLYALPTADRMIRALKGSAAERAILVRDLNRLVRTAAVGSPRVSEAEAEALAAREDVAPDVLDEVARRGEWLRRPAIVARLVRNPHTPPARVELLMSRLDLTEVEAVARDRAMPMPVRRWAYSELKKRRSK